VLFVCEREGCTHKGEKTDIVDTVCVRVCVCERERVGGGDSVRVIIQ